MSGSKEEVKGARGLKASVRTNGHAASGGHSSRATVKQNSALSRVNRTRWDISDGITGDYMPNPYQEYPKHIYPDADKPKHYIVVNDAEQERQALGGEEVISEEAERSRLLAVASVNKVQVDKRWGPAKLTKAIESAGFDPTLDPFK